MPTNGLASLGLPGAKTLVWRSMSEPLVQEHRSLRDLPAFSPMPWQMSYGERTVIEGMLAMLKPTLAIEIGRAEGGSLRRLAEHSGEVISLDIVEPTPEVAALPNVKALAGDSHALLPQELARLAGEGRNVDFVLVDGDHSAAGVLRDMRDLLESPALTSTVILAHDALNEEVRQGLQEVDYDAHEKIAWVDLDFIPGYVARLPARLGECWGGLGLIVVDASGAFRSGGPRHSTDLFVQPKLVWPAANWIRGEGSSGSNSIDDLTLVSDSLLHYAQRSLHELEATLGETRQRLSTAEAELGEVQHEHEQLAAALARERQWLQAIQASASWRLTAPLRSLKRRLKQRLDTN